MCNMAKLFVATSDLKLYHVSTDLVRALTGELAGPAYAVQFHTHPGYVLHVEADSVDAAHRRAIEAVQDSGGRLRQTGATITSLDN